ncbi:MAG TPA: hypothetical protein VFG10_06645 [Saprospiraceae bacterium]|nr:hypothetical protein [Saprospiraceae bacterium]
MTIKERFLNAIKRGTGEAHLLMKANPKLDFSNAIIKAAKKNLSYDPQSEGSRAEYVFELIQLSDKKEKIRKAILNSLATEREDTWALEQLFDLAALFANQGDKKAKKAIYKRYLKKTIQGSDWAGEDALIAIDGIEGLKYIAEAKGKIINKYPDGWELSWRVDDFQENNPTINVYEELKKASGKNKYIKVYLSAILKNKTGFQKPESPRCNYEIVTDKIKSMRIVPLWPSGAIELSKKDIKKLADDFLIQTVRLKLEKYMRVFNLVKYPYDYQPILKLAKSKYNRKDRLPEFSCGALKYFSGTDIRKFAIEILNKTNNPADYLDLLVLNYKKRDHEMLTSIVNKTKLEYKVHALVWGYINIYNANPTKECVPPLTALYDKLTCGLHRTDIVKIMIDNNVLPDRILEEIKHDSYPATRNLLKTRKS